MDIVVDCVEVVVGCGVVVVGCGVVANILNKIDDVNSFLITLEFIILEIMVTNKKIAEKNILL